MLHGMIPAAFFATLLRRYLDSLTESPEYIAPSSGVGCLGTSAAVATLGMAVYGLARMSKKKPPISTTETNESVRPSTPQKKESNLRIDRKPIPKKVSRKRHRKGKRWFMRHMKHYKSKYGHQIGRLMHHYLGLPLSEPSAVEPVDLDGSDEEDEPEEDHNDESYPPRVVDDNGEDSPAASKDRFEDDDESKEARKRSSSLDLKNLLRDNFETQRMRRCDKDGSSGSLASRSTTESCKSSCSKDSSIRHSRSSSKKSRSSSKRSRSRCRSMEKRNRKPRRRRFTSIPRKTRSGRCYNKSTS